MKLKVDFLYPETVVGLASSPTPVKPVRTVGQNVDTIRNRITKESTSNNLVDSNAETPPDKILLELKNLKNKYDTVVEYTVRLTAERDLMVQRLEGTEKEIATIRKKSNQSDNSTSSKVDKIVEKKSHVKVRENNFMLSLQNVDFSPHLIFIYIQITFMNPPNQIVSNVIVTLSVVKVIKFNLKNYALFSKLLY